MLSATPASGGERGQAAQQLPAWKPEPTGMPSHAAALGIAIRPKAPEAAAPARPAPSPVASGAEFSSSGCEEVGSSAEESDPSPMASPTPSVQSSNLEES